MINLKKQDPVADAVKDILQQEALKGNQHKIDKNKNNKIDAHDFKILRGEKPEVKEGWDDMIKAGKERAERERQEMGTGKFDKREVKPGVVRYTKKPEKYEPAEKTQKEEVEQVQEREMTSGETAERERIVKGMKKSLKGFKARYGERAKSVMYATATKQAMKEEEISEGKRPEGDTVPFVTGANTTSSPMNKIKEVAGAAMKKISKDLKTK